MSEKLKTHSAPNRLNSLKSKARKSGALAMSIGAMGGILVPTAKAENLSASKAKVEHIQRNLKNPNQLPGLKIHLSAERLNELKSATVEMGIRVRPDLLPAGTPDEPFQPLCTAVKVNIAGDPNNEFATSAHCAGSITNALHGVFSDPSNPNIKAENYTDLSQYQFAILDPNETDLNARKVRPVALVEQISVSTDDKDLMLMRATAVNYPDVSPTVRTLDQIPALPYKAIKKPLPGTPAAIYGVPQASGFEAQMTTGTYLGRIPEAYKDDLTGKYVTRYVDVFGVNVALPQLDGCNFGGSGSVAELPNGDITGNLTERVSLGYGPTQTMQPADGNIEDRLAWVTFAEQVLDIKIKGVFNLVCSYSVLGGNTPQQMVSGFNTPAPGMGGDHSGNG